MKIIEPSIEILTPVDPASLSAMMARLERAGRVCYKSEDKITADSAAKFVRGLIANGHHSVIEHESLSVRIVCDRGVSHELVRHRLASYSQESTRYVNYKDGLTVVRPRFWERQTYEFFLWQTAMLDIEAHYQILIESGASPQEARCVLPNSLKTEIVMTANLRQWRHILAQRMGAKAHPQMRQIAEMIFLEFTEILPDVFEDISTLRRVPK